MYQLCYVQSSCYSSCPILFFSLQITMCNVPNFDFNTLFTTYLQITIGVNTLDPVFNRSTDNPGNPGYQCANAIILFPM